MQNRNSRPEVFCVKRVFKKFPKFTGKHLCRSLFLDKVAGLSFLLKKRLRHGCFRVNLAKFLRRPISKENVRWLHLKIETVDA